MFAERVQVEPLCWNACGMSSAGARLSDGGSHIMNVEMQD